VGKYEKTNHPGIYKYLGKCGKVNYGISFYEPGAKKVRKIIGPHLKNAQEALAKVRGLKKTGAYGFFKASQKKTFDDLLKKYRATIQDQKNYEHSIKYITNTLSEKFRGKLLLQINYETLDDFRNERKKTLTQYGAQRSDRTVDIEISVLRKMFKKAFQWGWIEQNPFDRGDLFFRKTGKRERALTPIEVRQLIDASSEELKPIILVAILTGLRKGDILNLQWKDIDFDRTCIILTEGKTEKTRIIHLSQDMVNLFQRLPVRGEYIFPSPKQPGEPLKDIKRAFSRAVKGSGIDPGQGNKRVVFHTLRHSCVSQLIERGADSLMVRNYIGHASTQMTEAYAHLSEEYQRRTGQLLDGLYDIESATGKKLVRNESIELKGNIVSA
jgi:integrase